DDGRLRHPATITVLHNGVLVQNHVTLAGPTSYVGAPNYEIFVDMLLSSFLGLILLPYEGDAILLI
ncbi:MAG: hypothetical protein AAF629_30725, partial [Chloroflexota bacterium]